VEGLV
jgi:hypothetical protein